MVLEKSSLNILKREGGGGEKESRGRDRGGGDCTCRGILGNGHLQAASLDIVKDFTYKPGSGVTRRVTWGNHTKLKPRGTV